jgi:hypothetical protein
MKRYSNITNMQSSAAALPARSAAHTGGVLETTSAAFEDFASIKLVRKWQPDGCLDAPTVGLELRFSIGQCDHPIAIPLAAAIDLHKQLRTIFG